MEKSSTKIRLIAIGLAGPLLMGLCVGASEAQRTDTVVLDSGTIKGKVFSITDTGVSMGGKNVYPLAKVKGVVMGLSSVKPYPSRLIFRDGSVLCGSIGKIGKDSVTFMSPSVGAVEVPLSDVAVLNFNTGKIIPKDRPTAGAMLAVLSSGVKKEGIIFAVLAGQIVFKTAEGIEKLDEATVENIILSDFPNVARIVLRNGDRINAKGSWKGDQYEFNIAGTSFRVSLESVRGIRF